MRIFKSKRAQKETKTVDNKKANINLASIDSVKMSGVEQYIYSYGQERNNYSTYENLYLYYSDVATAIDTIAAYAVGGGYNINGDISDKVKGDVITWLNEQGFTRIILNVVKSMLIYGDAYILISDKQNGQGYELQVLDPNKTYININLYGEVIDYVFSPLGAIWQPGNNNSEFIHLPPDRVLHFSYGNVISKSPYGSSLLRSVKELLDTKINLEKIASTMAWRMTHPLIHAKVGDEQNPPTLSDILNIEGLLKNRVREDGTIANNITTSYTVDIKSIPSNPDLNGLTTVLNHIQEQVDKALKVPKILMGQPEGSNRATSYNQLKGFIIFLEHIRNIIKDEINAKLIPLIAPGAIIEFNEVLKEDTFAWADVAVKLYHEGIITVDEARAMVELPPSSEE